MSVTEGVVDDSAAEMKELKSEYDFVAASKCHSFDRHRVAVNSGNAWRRNL
jgi:hypothetical protein